MITIQASPEIIDYLEKMQEMGCAHAKGAILSRLMIVGDKFLKEFGMVREWHLRWTAHSLDDDEDPNSEGHDGFEAQQACAVLQKFHDMYTKASEAWVGTIPIDVHLDGIGRPFTPEEAAVRIQTGVRFMEKGKTLESDKTLEGRLAMEWCESCIVTPIEEDKAG